MLFASVLGIPQERAPASLATSTASACAWEQLPHSVDAVISHKHKLVYVDNVKGGSTTIRSLMQTVLGATWSDSHCCQGDTIDAEAKGCNTGVLRSTTKCLDPNHDYFVFSVVRHPVAKFESGVRQARRTALQHALVCAYANAGPDPASVTPCTLASYDPSLLPWRRHGSRTRASTQRRRTIC